MAIPSECALFVPFSTGSDFSTHISCTTGPEGKEGDHFVPKNHLQTIVPPLLKQKVSICLYVLRLYHAKLTCFLPGYSLSASQLRNCNFVFSFPMTTILILDIFSRN